jgi:uncharacterized membrane protein YfcA
MQGNQRSRVDEPQGSHVKIRLLIYKLLTIVWFSLLIAAMVFLSQGAFNRSLAALLIALCVVGIQAALIRCPYCHARPGLWLLAIWTLLLDLPFYIADVLLLRECPRCERQLVAMPAKSMGSVT